MKQLSRAKLPSVAKLPSIFRFNNQLRAYSSPTSGNADEMAHFAQLANSWWDPTGPQRILHKMNIMRLDFIKEVLRRGPEPGYSLELLPEASRKQFFTHRTDLDVLDVGCGGGLLSESLARWPQVSTVTGIDVTPEVISTAQTHAKLDPDLRGKLTYHQKSVEELAATDMYDVVTMFEVVEHLDDPAKVLHTAMSHVKPNGYLFLSTINRTLLSYLTTIAAGEYIFGIVPKGTHTWSKYINESELKEWLEGQSGWNVVKSQGCIYIPPPFAGEWLRFDDASTLPVPKLLNCGIGTSGGNYVLAAQKSS